MADLFLVSEFSFEVTPNQDSQENTPRVQGYQERDRPSVNKDRNNITRKRAQQYKQKQRPFQGILAAFP